MPSLLSTSDIAELIGTKPWRVRRLYEDGNLPEPMRLAGRRAISRESLPTIIDAMRDRGWLPRPSEKANREVEASHA